MSFNFTQLIPGVGHEYSHVATAGLVSGALIVASFSARKALGTGEQAVVPSDKFSLRGAFELTTEFITGLVDRYGDRPSWTDIHANVCRGFYFCFGQ
jgi:F-type H+-transporting ATPase subunit a